MSYKRLLIKKILETDESIDKKILALIEHEEKNAEAEEMKEAVISMEDREHERKPVDLDADIDTGKAHIKATAQDVSLCGAFIRTQEAIDKGENIAIRLISGDGEEFEFISEVVRKEPSGIGILIKNISSSHKERFHKFLEKL
ncbi:PilZ domain-containing protein [Desulfocicer niacini]